ncbi:MAG: type IV secretion system DNA-binding domain-containing protein [Elusimicrobiota bacterium]|jgi:type IV secretory pathway TraG/TraD family ATPase VirD4
MTTILKVSPGDPRKKAQERVVFLAVLLGAWLGFLRFILTHRNDPYHLGIGTGEFILACVIAALPTLLFFSVGIVAWGRYVIKNAEVYIEWEGTAKEQEASTQEKARAEWEAKPAKEKAYHGLWMGYSAGLLAGRGHNYGISDTTLGAMLDPEDTYKNIIVFGSIGSGKTTRAINPLLKQVLSMDTGALIFDIKTDYVEEVQALCRMTDRTYKVIGDGGVALNLIGGCSPDLAASFLESCFSAKGQGSGDSSSFFVQSAVELCRNCLLLMDLVGAEYTIRNLNKVIFNDEDRDALMEQLSAKFSANEFDEEQEIAAEMVVQFFKRNWADHDEKVAKSIRSTVSSVLSPLQSPGMVRAFSPTGGKEEADLPSMINDGEIFLVNIPRTKYGDGGSRYAYMLLKLGFMNMMRARTSRKDWNQTRPVAFVCDEYQAIIDPISDVDFWDKSRSTKTIGMVSMQGVSSMVQALGKDTTANAILQNFRQKLIFRTEDQATYGMIQSVLGQIDVLNVNRSSGHSDGVGTSTSYNSPRNNSTNQGWNENTSENWTRQELFGANDMRNLTTDQVLFIGNCGGTALDEVLNVQPLYVKQ